MFWKSRMTVGPRNCAAVGKPLLAGNSAVGGTRGVMACEPGRYFQMSPMVDGSMVVVPRPPGMTRWPLAELCSMGFLAPPAGTMETLTVVSADRRVPSPALL